MPVLPTVPEYPAPAAALRGPGEAPDATVQHGADDNRANLYAQFQMGDLIRGADGGLEASHLEKPEDECVKAPTENLWLGPTPPQRGFVGRGVESLSLLWGDPIIGVASKLATYHVSLPSVTSKPLVLSRSASARAGFVPKLVGPATATKPSCSHQKPTLQSRRSIFCKAVRTILDIPGSSSWAFSIEPGIWRCIIMNFFGNALKFAETRRNMMKFAGNSSMNGSLLKRSDMGDANHEAQSDCENTSRLKALLENTL
ncbi:hypothetical protein B0J12DRAFT_703946 [Macrophomina phaseolina]|uniref:Uncharacterized protein n=1 Tax=Macrophomina phaseolina TaxID=35725 RepID=A0ABQ8FXX7_9PEZI|nr:hypothetical protein B0J12DRAFT_703946 [Macrophomina phaseolina]